MVDGTGSADAAGRVPRARRFRRLAVHGPRSDLVQLPRVRTGRSARMTASSTQGHDAAERSFGLTPAAEGLVRLTEGGHFDATLVLVEVVEAEAEAGRPFAGAAGWAAPPRSPPARRSRCSAPPPAGAGVRATVLRRGRRPCRWRGGASGARRLAVRTRRRRTGVRGR